ncbi:MAG: RsmB/NOP family class I SAM-dependent RNA methyltransferase [Dysgonamonadaceae bacterium]|nr:RsmB/NOP family class I SAM-dependent RNA methyltransferase [Dysgonamonadaceae bacterium]
MQLPAAFISQTKALLGKEWEAFEQALRCEPPTSIRWNPQKTNANRLPPTVFEPESPVAWASNAYYLRRRPRFTLDPLFHAGCYYVQEASSMFLEYFITKYVLEAAVTLDLCAAPGGKSTHLSAMLPEGSLLVANETVRPRAAILLENLIKWGNPHTVVTNASAAEVGKLKAFFDVIVCDLPCSGEGMFRKDPVAIAEWSERNVECCAGRQRQIIADVLPALKPGGLLIYSTCTYNREENEDNVDHICQDFGAELLEPPRRFMPHKTKGEGFFIAALRRSGEPERPPDAAPRRMETTLTLPFSQWLSAPGEYVFFSENNAALAFPATRYREYLYLKKSLRMLSAGVALGEIKGKDAIPNHALAMSTALSETAFPRWELNRDAALKYLRKEPLRDIPTALPSGFVAVTYQNHPLGFVKNIWSRANNLYPQAWRVRMMVND